MILKTENGWKVVSHSNGRSFGTYKTKREAKVRLKNIKMFSRLRK